MALFEVEATMNVGERHWQNRWDVDADDITTVVGMIDTFHDFHLATLLDIYQLGRIKVRPAGERDAFFETVFDVAGSIALGAEKPMPLFNTIRLLLNTTVGGRPGMKFLRGLLRTVDVTVTDTVAAPILGAVTAAGAALLASVETLGGNVVLTNGKAASAVTAQPNIQMRQLHRKRKYPVL